MKKLTKRIVAMGAAVMMMASMSVMGASAADFTVNLTSLNNVNYEKNVYAYNKSFSTSVNGLKKFTSIPVSFSIYASLENVNVSLQSTNNSREIKVTSEIHIYNKAKNAMIFSDKTSVKDGSKCTMRHSRTATSSNHRYTLMANAYYTSKNADPFTTQNVMLRAYQYDF